MYPGCARVVTLYEGLRRIDEELAGQVRARGCPDCGGRLDSGPWPRNPRGLPWAERQSWRRLGLCCAGCRRRVLPPSALFLGRKVYFAAIVLVSVAALQRRTVGASATALRRMFGMCEDTLRRWVSFFAVDVPQSTWWRTVRGRVSAEVRDEQLPDALLAQWEEHGKPGEAALAACLTFLATAAVPVS